MSTITVHCPNEDCEAEIELDVSYRAGSPGRSYGPPEQCEPPDPSECELDDVNYAASGCPNKCRVWDKADLEALERAVNRALKEYTPPEYEPDEDDMIRSSRHFYNSRYDY